jgi:hypothetical protein
MIEFSPHERESSFKWFCSMLYFCSDRKPNVFARLVEFRNTMKINRIQLLGFSADGMTMSWFSSFLTIAPKVFPKSPPAGYGSGLGLRLFSGERDPVGSLVLTAAASVASCQSSALSYSGLLSLEPLLRFPNIGACLFQKPLLRLPFPSRRHAGGLYLPPDTESAISESVSERKPE